MTLPVLSPSKIKLWLLCPKRYDYRYNQHLKDPSNEHAVFGSAIHETIERMYDAPDYFHLNDAYDVFDEELYAQMSKTGIALTKEHQQLGYEILEKYSAGGYWARDPQDLEYEFFLEFPDEENPICVINGFFDQVYDWGFVDLKTSKKKPSSNAISKDIQFVLYAWAFEKLKGYAPERGVWLHLRTGEEVDMKINKEELDIATHVIQKVISDTEYKDNFGWPCKFCPYTVPCLGV